MIYHPGELLDSSSDERIILYQSISIVKLLLIVKGRNEMKMKDNSTAIVASVNYASFITESTSEAKDV